jgi:hypothetical protein
MSFTAVHEVRRTRHTCQSCLERKARFSYRGTVKADRDHTLCFECFRRERERQRSRKLTEVPCDPAPMVGPALEWAPRPLNDRQREHRRAMLTNLTQQA